jgi:hypothetical protein
MVTILLLFSFIVSIVVSTPNRSFFYLGKSRDMVDAEPFLPYTKAQKLQVAMSIHNQFRVYVHRDRKVEQYDAEFKIYKATNERRNTTTSYTIDPIARSAQLIETAASLSDAEFHAAYSELYLSLKDLHTNYYVPGTFYDYPISLLLIKKYRSASLFVLCTALGFYGCQHRS